MNIIRFMAKRRLNYIDAISISCSSLAIHRGEIVVAVLTWVVLAIVSVTCETAAEESKS